MLENALFSEKKLEKIASALGTPPQYSRWPPAAKLPHWLKPLVTSLVIGIEKFQVRPTGHQTLGELRNKQHVDNYLKTIKTTESPRNELARSNSEITSMIVSQIAVRDV